MAPIRVQPTPVISRGHKYCHPHWGETHRWMESCHDSWGALEATHGNGSIPKPTANSWRSVEIQLFPLCSRGPVYTDLSIVPANNNSLWVGCTDLIGCIIWFFFFFSQINTYTPTQHTQPNYPSPFHSSISATARVRSLIVSVEGRCPATWATSELAGCTY